MGSGGYGFWEVFSLLGTVQGAFLASVLWTHARGNRSANRLLALLLFLFTLQLLHIVLYWTRSLAFLPHFFGVPWFFPILYGPLLFLYARSLDPSRRALRPSDFAHALPFLLVLALFARFYLSSSEVKRRILEASYERITPASGLVLAVFAFQFLHFLGYMAASLRESSGREPRGRWMRRLLLAFAVTFAWWFAYGLAVSLGLPYWRAIDYGATLAMTATIYAIGYTALREPEIFVGELRRQKGRYERSSLSFSEVEEHRARLLEVMAETKPYTDATLRLTDLAVLVGLPSHQLSQVINQGLDESYNDFVNRYRVEEAKRLLSDPRRGADSLLALAFEAGFNNKTSFNEAFKKHARTTPSRFRASARAAS
ncbi:MAG TPA: helix-turn-helix domain-containing protein [Vicinamibacteria bacterium]